MGLTEKIKESPGTFTTSSSEESDHLTPFWYFRIFAASRLNADIIRVLEVFKPPRVFVTVASSSSFCAHFIFPNWSDCGEVGRCRLLRKVVAHHSLLLKHNPCRLFFPSKIHGPLELLSRWLCSTLDPWWREWRESCHLEGGKEKYSSLLLPEWSHNRNVSVTVLRLCRDWAWLCILDWAEHQYCYSSITSGAFSSIDCSHNQSVQFIYHARLIRSSCTKSLNKRARELKVKVFKTFTIELGYFNMGESSSKFEENFFKNKLIRVNLLKGCFFSSVLIFGLFSLCFCVSCPTYSHQTKINDKQCISHLKKKKKSKETTCWESLAHIIPILSLCTLKHTRTRLFAKSHQRIAFHHSLSVSISVRWKETTGHRVKSWPIFWFWRCFWWSPLLHSPT